jgi:hypothetical protein
MVARTRPERSRLLVQFAREGEEPERIHVADGEQALAQALYLLAKRHALLVGDALTVLHGDAGPDLPEASRSSHYS